MCYSNMSCMYHEEGRNLCTHRPAVVFILEDWKKTGKRRMLRKSDVPNVFAPGTHFRVYSEGRYYFTESGGEEAKLTVSN